VQPAEKKEIQKLPPRRPLVSRSKKSFTFFSFRAYILFLPGFLSLRGASCGYRGPLGLSLPDPLSVRFLNQGGVSVNTKVMIYAILHLSSHIPATLRGFPFSSRETEKKSFTPLPPFFSDRYSSHLLRGRSCLGTLSLFFPPKRLQLRLHKYSRLLSPPSLLRRGPEDIARLPSSLRNPFRSRESLATKGVRGRRYLRSSFSRDDRRERAEL